MANFLQNDPSNTAFSLFYLPQVGGRVGATLKMRGVGRGE